MAWWSARAGQIPPGRPGTVPDFMVVALEGVSLIYLVAASLVLGQLVMTASIVGAVGQCGVIPVEPGMLPEAGACSSTEGAAVSGETAAAERSRKWCFPSFAPSAGVGRWRGGPVPPEWWSTPSPAAAQADNAPGGAHHLGARCKKGSRARSGEGAAAGCPAGTRLCRTGGGQSAQVS